MADEIKPTTDAAALTEKKGRAPKAVKPKRQVPRGRAYIHATFNNTIVTFTDMEGNAIAWSSAGHLGFSGPKKATPYASTQIVRDVVQKAQPYGLREVFVFVKGVGGGRESAIRTLNASGVQVLSIKDQTPIPHNGPRAPKPRRI